MAEQDQVHLSVVIPVLDEAESLPGLVAEIREAVAPLHLRWELILVDDGSRDDSFAVMRKLHAESPGQVRVIRFRRNFGKSAALQAGFAAARGQAVITLDGDGQDDPHEIPRLLAALGEGYDLVSGWKQQRRDPLAKVLASRLFNRVVAALTGIRLHDFNCGFKAYRADLTRELRLYGELHRYIPVLAHALGYRVTEIPVAHRPRTHGRSKYGLERMPRGYLDLHTVLLTTRYGSRPLHFFGSCGLVLLGLGLVINLYLSALWLLHYRPIGDRPLLLLGVLLLIAGIQLISLGLVGEMIVSRDEGRITYSIAERLD